METAGIQAALFGIRENLDRLETTARRIATEVPAQDLPRDMVELRVARHGVAANAQTLRTADEILGTLLDVFG